MDPSDSDSIESPSHHPTSCSSPHDTAPKELESSLTSLHFNDRAAVFDEKASTVIFPPFLDVIPFSTNGTWVNEAKFMIKEPTTTAANVSKIVHSNKVSLHWTALKSKVVDLTDAVSDDIIQRLHHAFEGHDAVEMGNKIICRMPVIKVPTERQVEHAIDTLWNALQHFLERPPPGTTFEDDGLQGKQWLFAREMGYRARQALFHQGICKPWEVVPSQINMQWQLRINQALVKLALSNEKIFTTSQLLDMDLIWVGDRDKKVWRLEIDTSMVDTSFNNGELVQTPVYLHTGFELLESSSSASVEDACRRFSTVDDDWVMLE